MWLFVHYVTFSENKEQVNSTQSKWILEDHWKETWSHKARVNKSETWSRTNIYSRFTSKTSCDRNRCEFLISVPFFFFLIVSVILGLLSYMYKTFSRKMKIRIRKDQQHDKKNIKENRHIKLYFQLKLPFLNEGRASETLLTRFSKIFLSS